MFNYTFHISLRFLSTVVQVQFNQVSYTAMEGERIDVLIITNTTASFDIQVSVFTQGLSVSQDFYLPRNPVTIIAGESTAILPLFLVTDVEVEDTEQLRLELVLVNTTVSNVELGANKDVVINVENVDVCFNATGIQTLQLASYLLESSMCNPCSRQ